MKHECYCCIVVLLIGAETVGRLALWFTCYREMPRYACAVHGCRITEHSDYMFLSCDPLYWPMEGVLLVQQAR